MSSEGSFVLNWQDLAACREVDTRLFFPDEGQSGALAKAICRRCPVRNACLAEALDNPGVTGIWGGTDDEQRRRLRRGRAGRPLVPAFRR